MNNKADNLNVHIANINTSLTELHEISGTLRNIGAEPHKYINVCVITTIVFMTAAANSLDNGDRTATFEDFADWLNLQAIIFRTFFSIAHTCMEHGISSLCESHCLIPESSEKKDF